MEFSEDPKLVSAKDALVASIDARERAPDPKEQYPEDWSRTVQYTIDSYVRGLEEQMKTLSPYLPNIEEEKAVELNLFVLGLRSIDTEVKKKRLLNKAAIDKLCADIEDGFGVDENVLAAERRVFLSLADKEPEQILYNFFDDNLDSKPYAQELVKKAAFNLVEQGKLEELSDLSYLNDQVPYYRALMTMAFKRADAEKTVILIEGMTTRSVNDYQKFTESGPWPEEVKSGYVHESKIKITEYVSEAQIRTAFLVMAKQNPRWLLGKHVSNELPGAREACLVAFQNLEPEARLGYLHEVQWRLKDELHHLGPLLIESMEASSPEILIQTYPEYAPFVERTVVEGMLAKSASKKPTEFLRAIQENERRGWKGSWQNANTIQDNFSFKEFARIAAESLYNGPIEAAFDFYTGWNKTQDPAYLFPAGYEQRLIDKILFVKPDFFLTDNWYMKSWIEKRPDKDLLQEKAQEVIKKRTLQREWIEKALLGSIPADEKLEDGTKKRRPDLFWKDPALRDIDLIDPQWFSPRRTDEVAAYTVMITRNLFYAQIPVNRESVRLEYARIQEAQKLYGNLPLFKDRNVVVLSHNETWESGEDRFGKSAFIHKVESATGSKDKVRHFEGGKTLESLRMAKEKVLKEIVQCPSPMTFFFDGHGTGEAIYLSDGKMSGLKKEDPYETEDTIKITRVELVEALNRRRLEGKDISKDIFIIDACSSQTFSRTVQENLIRLKSPSPIFVSVSEYDQYGFSDTTGPYGSDFTDWMFNSPANRQVLGDFWRLDTIPYHNPSVFIPPDGVHGLMQVADAEESQVSDDASRG